MNWSKLNALIFIAFLGCNQVTSQNPAINNLKTDYLTQVQIDSIFHMTKNFPNHTQFSLALIQDGKEIYYGFERVNDTLITIVNKGKAFEIGSISKVFTASLLAKFVINGDISLNDNINPYFDFPINNNLEFNFVELANHTSGLPRLPSNIHLSAIFNPKNPYKTYDEKKLDEYLINDISLDYIKGSKSEYSNLGMGLLSYTLRKLSGYNYERLLKEGIFDKYEMTHSSTVKENISDILIGGLDASGKPTPNWESGALIGAGGIFSTVIDLSKFAFAQFDSTNKELALTRVKTFQENETWDVGLGWFISNRKDGCKCYWHNGRTGGYTSSMVIDVENKKGVIILSNISSYHRDSENVDKLCFILMETLQGN